MKSKLRETMQAIGFMFRFCRQVNPSVFLPDALALLLSTAGTAAFILLPRYVIDDLAQMTSWEEMLPSIVLLVGVIFGIQFLQKLLLPWQAKQINLSDVQTGLYYDKLFADTPYANQKSSLVQDTRYKLFFHVHVNTFLSLFFDEFLGGILCIVLFGSLFLQLNVWIFLALFCSACLNYLIDLRRKKLRYRFEAQSAKSKRKIDYLASVLMNFENAKELRVNCSSEYIQNKYNAQMKDYQVKNDAVVKKEIRLGLLENAVYFVFQLSVYLGIAFLLFKQSISIGEMTMYISAILTFYTYMKKLFSSVGALGYYRVYVKDFQAFREELGRDSRQQEGVQLPEEWLSRFVLQFEDVSFCYPGSVEEALSHVSMSIHAGEKIALVGLNGAGKSTFIKLICRLYRPTSGRITLNGTDIFDFTFGDYMRLVSAVFQNYKLFSFSMRENIVLAQPLEEGRLQDCLKKSQFSAVAGRLKRGLDTSYTHQFDENGVELSGGEAEHLAMARALYRDAPILILDEPTAAVDAVAERKFYEELSAIAQEKAVLFISHRLSSAKFCNRVVVFDKGRVVSQGEHAGLMAEHGIYETMFSHQADYYDCAVPTERKEGAL